MNGFVRFLCLIFGISVDGGASQREQWAKRRRELGIEPSDDGRPPDDERATPERQPTERAHADRK
jgi:hypothetical protein